ncbi:MAG TPA: type IV pilus biogenesis/stability protein PilW [Albitalea sp.]|uniref:type IV pilus biogenesis/stability protein PilW n=1 Tax=Piscinibacter sp. TaxID=1903157 RepID=UPI002ED26AA4
MSWECRAMQRVVMGLAVAAAAAWLSGCAGMPGPRTTGADAPSTETKDRVTASDETEAAKRARVRLELAAAYFGRGQLTTALDEVKLAIAANPTDPSAFNLRGLIYAGLGDDRLAEESFRRALQLDARDADTMQNYGWYLCQQKRYAEADAQFRQALDVPHYRAAPRTLLTQGICQARAGQWPQAEASLTRSYELDPGNPATAVNLAEVLYRRGEFERARFQMRRVNGNPDIVNAQTLWLAARIENRLGNRQGVQDFGTQLRNRFPQSPEAGAFARGQFDE